MNLLNQIKKIFSKFDFEYSPIGMNFTLIKPKSIDRLNKKLAFCEMFREAQDSTKPFFVDYENHVCGGGPGTLGQGGVIPELTYAIHSGMFGPKLGVFKKTLANRRTLLSYPKFEKGTVNYVIFSNLKSMQESPDVMMITARPRQAEIILRASSYVNGNIWETKNTNIVGCAWLTAYPLLTGKINYTMTGLGFGMIAREIWPEGLILLSIPYDLLSNILNNLEEMEWVLNNYKVGKDQHDYHEKLLFDELMEELQLNSTNTNKNL